MKGVWVERFGGPEEMQIRELPDPVAGPGQVVVAVHASGINFAETRMRAGTYGGQEARFGLGMEAAGVVESLGPGVAGFTIGDRVFGRARGSHAEKVVFEAEHLLPLPDSLSFVQGAAIPVGWLTAWHGLMTVADLQPGQRLLIEAVASSVGVAALQIGKWRGCWVAGTASQDAKLARAKARGLDAAYNYLREDVAARVLADTNGEGVDVAMLTVGGDTGENTLNALGMDGKALLFGSTGGMRMPLDLRIGARNLSLLSFSISTARSFVPVSMKSFREVALPLFANGTFSPDVDTVLPLEGIHEAHRRVAQRSHFGKIILQVRPT